MHLESRTQFESFKENISLEKILEGLKAVN